MEFWYPSKMGYSTKGWDFVVLLLLFLCSPLGCSSEGTEAHQGVLSAVWSLLICCNQSAALGGAYLLSHAVLTSPRDLHKWFQNSGFAGEEPVAEDLPGVFDSKHN